jgi:hypothetical protein
MDTTYTAAAAWIHMDTSWILHRLQQQQQVYTWIHHGYYIHSSSMDTHGYTWIHHEYYIHSSSSMDTHGYIMGTTTSAETAWIHKDTSWIIQTQQQ